MGGVLRETCYAAVKEQHESKQSLLSEYAEVDEPITIAVVSLPRNTGIEEYCDCWCPELGMPEYALRRFWSYKSGYEGNSAVDEPAWRAWNDASLEPRYREHIRTSESAQNAINSIVSRLNDGDDVTLVCFEESGEPCHRHILMDEIESRRSSSFDFVLREDRLTL